jgi:hypothetical protein
MLRQVPRVLFQLPLGLPDAGDHEGFAVAAMPDGGCALQLGLELRRLAGAASLPVFHLPAEAARELAHALLAEFDPEASERLRKTARGDLRLVQGGVPEDAA